MTREPIPILNLPGDEDFVPAVEAFGPVLAPLAGYCVVLLPLRMPTPAVEKPLPRIGLSAR